MKIVRKILKAASMPGAQDAGFSLVSVVISVGICVLGALTFVHGYSNLLTANRNITSTKTYDELFQVFPAFIRGIIDQYALDGGCTPSRMPVAVNSRTLGKYGIAVFNKFIPVAADAPPDVAAAANRCSNPQLPGATSTAADSSFHFCFLITNSISATTDNDDFLKGNNIFAEVRVDLKNFYDWSPFYCSQVYQSLNFGGYYAFQANYSVYWSWNSHPGDPSHVYKRKHGTFLYASEPN